MFDPPESRRSAIVRHLIFLGWLEFWLTALPGAICCSPLLCMWLSGTIPVFGYVALVMTLPALLVAVYFIPSLRLIRIFTPYQPQTLRGGSLLPLPAYSLADWALLLGAHAALIAAIWATCSIAAAAIGWVFLKVEEWHQDRIIRK